MESEYEAIKVEDEKNIGDYIKIKTQITTLSKDFLRYLTSPHYIIPFMNSGRLLKVLYKKHSLYSIKVFTQILFYNRLYQMKA